MQTEYVLDMSAVTKGFDKDAERLEKTLHELSGEKSILKAETDKARKAMQEAQKQFANTRNEADGLAASLASQEYEDYRRKLEAINKTMKDTEKQIRSVEGVAGKAGSGMKSGIGTLVAALATNGIGQIASQLAQEGVISFATSAMGGNIGNLISGGISSAISGMSIGAMINPGFGTAIGAVAGLAAGGISGGIQNAQAKDDAFKSYYKDLYDTVNTNTTEGLTAGKTLAAARETNKLSFGTQLGSENAADSFLADVLHTANTTPFLYDDLVGISKTLLSFGTAVEDVIPTLTTVGDAGAAMGLSTADIGTVATYLGRMKSSDKATLEYLDPLNERGFSVFQWIADAKGTSVGNVYDMISKSQLSGGEVNSIILSKFDELYQGQMERQSQTTEGLESTLQGLMENIQAAGGTGYNQLRNEGRSADIAAYGGELGKALEKVNSVAGENRAYLENLSEQYQREALSAVLLGEKTSVFGTGDTAKLEEMRAAYQEAEQEYENGSREAGLKMENLREQAEAVATAAYESSSAYQQAQDAELEQIAAIRENTVGIAAVTNALNKSNEFTKGEASTRSFWATDEIVGDISFNASAQSHAFGLRYVPYDNYPALLHQGERVQTAEEARRSTGGMSVKITGNEFIIRNDNDIQAIAVCLADELEARAVAHGG